MGRVYAAIRNATFVRVSLEDDDLEEEMKVYWTVVEIALLP